MKRTYPNGVLDFSPPLSLFFIIFYFGISREKRKKEEEEGSLPAIRETPPGLGRVQRGGSKLISLSSLLCWLLLSLFYIYIYIFSTWSLKWLQDLRADIRSIPGN